MLVTPPLVTVSDPPLNDADQACEIHRAAGVLALDGDRARDLGDEGDLQIATRQGHDVGAKVHRRDRGQFGSDSKFPVPVASSVVPPVLAMLVTPESVSDQPPLTSRLALLALVIVGKLSDTPPLIMNVVPFASVRTGSW